MPVSASTLTILIYDEAKPPSLILKKGGGGYLKYNLKTGSAGTQYASCRVRYVNPDTGQCIEGIAAVFTLPGNPWIAVGQTVQLDGWGGFSGKYFICQAKHSLGQGGYTTEITMRKCLGGY